VTGEGGLALMKRGMAMALDEKGMRADRDRRRPPLAYRAERVTVEAALAPRA
jgi:hypothetical protein